MYYFGEAFEEKPRRKRIVLEMERPDHNEEDCQANLPEGCRPDLEEDYEANYPGGCRPDPFTNSVIPIGQCDRMCSIQEMYEREQQQRLNRYETLTDEKPSRVDKNLAVKEFKRSVVGGECANVHELRPYSVLKKTIKHLLMTICEQEEEDWMFICDFVFDRLRAVRQDMIVQRIEGTRYCSILEGSVRFLVFSMYRLTCTLNDYSTTNPTEPIISMDGPVKGLNNYELNVVREMKLTMQHLRDCLGSLMYQYDHYVPNSPMRSLFQAVNLLVNLPFLHGHVNACSDFIKKRDVWENDSMFKIVFRMYREHLAGNHYSAMKLLPKLMDYPLLVLAYAPSLAHLQNVLMTRLIKAYSATGVSTSSLKYLSTLICPEFLDADQNERLAFAKLMATQYGIYDQDRNICDYKLWKKYTIPKDFLDNARFESHSSVYSGGDNETRIFSLQLIAGKNWYFYQQVLDLHSQRAVLNPYPGEEHVHIKPHSEEIMESQARSR